MSVSTSKNGKTSSVSSKSGSKKKTTKSKKFPPVTTRAGEVIRPSLMLMRSKKDGNTLAFGSVAVKTAVGDIVIEGVTIKVTKDKNIMASLPYKIKANKDEGGETKYLEEYGMPVVVGAKSYQTMVVGDGSKKIRDMLVSAYKDCLECGNCHPKEGTDFARCSKKRDQISFDSGTCDQKAKVDTPVFTDVSESEKENTVAEVGEDIAGLIENL